MMKKIIALLVLFSVLLLALPSQAETYYLGAMEVVNCDEWVSLREEPSTSSKRLAKVSLGATVHSCQAVDEEWIYAEFDGHAGYILAEYLQSCEGVTHFSAMLITNGEEDAVFYADMGGEMPIGTIPMNTVVRNCQEMLSGLTYVEYNGLCGFVDSELTEPYGDLMHYPQFITITCDWFNANSLPNPSLQVCWAEDFALPETYGEYVQDGAEYPAEFVLYSDSYASSVHLFNAEMVWDMEADTDTMLYKAELVNIQYLVDAENPLYVCAEFYGDMPNLMVGYMDHGGIYRFAFVEVSGEDGSIYLNEF